MATKKTEAKNTLNHANKRPRLTAEEKVEVERRVLDNKERFAIFALQGMLNTTRHILVKVLDKKDVKWFEDCITYMMEKIRLNRAKREVADLRKRKFK